jgi:type VI secretion system protein ImpC
MALDETAKKLQDNLLEPFGATSGDLLDKDKGKARSIVSHTEKELAGPDAKTLAKPFHFDERDKSISDAVRFMNAMAALLVNCDDALKVEDAGRPLAPFESYSNLVEAISLLTTKIDHMLWGYLDDIFHDPSFQSLEAAWRDLHHLASGVESSDVIIDFLDASKDDLHSDLVDHETDIFAGTLFEKVYTEEYDRYGGKPFASMIGLYEFDSSDADLDWLRAMGKVANASHCPFISAVAPTFFQPCKTMQDVAEIGDLDAMLSHPRFGKWKELRDTDYAAYIGLTLPRYLLRRPIGHNGHVEPGNKLGYRETVIPGRSDAESCFLWGNSAILFAKNMVRSFEESGWAQHIRGPKGGGIVQGLTVYTYDKNGYEEIQPPVEIAIPDYRELQFSQNGFISLLHKKNEATATFFGAQSIKKPLTFIEDLNTKNAHLVTNLAYTLSITRIAHFVKRMMREYIGSAADNAYIQQVLANWLEGYVTTIINPDDRTLQYYPFKAISVTVEPKPGPLGWYKAAVSVPPHSQFEGMDVELRLEAALGGP